MYYYIYFFTFLQELENGKSDEIEKAQLEADEKMNKAIDEIRELETEKRESALEEQRAKISELEINIEQLKAVSFKFLYLIVSWNILF